MGKSLRNGVIGDAARSCGGYTWLPKATVAEYTWSEGLGVPLRIRKELAQGRRVEIDLLDLRAICEQTWDESCTVREYFTVVRLDRTRPEVVLRRVTTLHSLGRDEDEQSGLVSSSGNPAAAVGLVSHAAEQSGLSALALLQSLYTLAPGDLLVKRVIRNLEELMS